MQVPINVKSPNNISKGQMGFNSTFKGLKKSSKQHARCDSESSLYVIDCQQCVTAGPMRRKVMLIYLKNVLRNAHGMSERNCERSNSD
jgi:hypothetical protein